MACVAPGSMMAAQGYRGGVFVTGTDTGVGKTVVSACLARRWGMAYWKPVQTGLAGDGGDSATVGWLAGLPAEQILAPRHLFRAPLSPEAASALEGKAVSLSDFERPLGVEPVVIEGAGGVLVPLGGGALMVDLMGKLGLPVVLVARGALGTINHSLLSLESLRHRGIAVLGIVVSGTCHGSTLEAIERHGRVRVIGIVPSLEPLSPESVAQACLDLPGWQDVNRVAA